MSYTLAFDSKILEIVSDLNKMPKIPDPLFSQTNPRLYIKIRVEETINTFQQYGLEPSYVYVYCSKYLVSTLKNTKSILGVKSIFTSSGMRLSSEDDLGHGTFMIDVLYKDPAGEYSKNTFTKNPDRLYDLAGHYIKGVACSWITTRQDYETRWVLQNVDKLQPGSARSIAALLNKEED